MKLLKRMAVLGLAVLALSACTKSSEESETVTGNEVDPAKQSAMDEIDETLAREDNILVEDETDTLFADADLYPQTVKMEFAADEASMTIDLSWVLKNGTSEEEAEEYAAMMVKQFNDIVAVQSTELENSSDSSFGTLWNQFALNVKVGTEDGKWLVDKSYKAGGKIDLAMPAAESQDGPEDVAEDVPKKEVKEPKATKEAK